MAKKCVVTKKQSQVGGQYSNRTRATKFNLGGKRRRYGNISRRRIFVPELGRYVSVNISTKGLKTLNKNGAYKTLKEAGAVK